MDIEEIMKKRFSVMSPTLENVAFTFSSVVALLANKWTTSPTLPTWSMRCSWITTLSRRTSQPPWYYCPPSLKSFPMTLQCEVWRTSRFIWSIWKSWCPTTLPFMVGWCIYSTTKIVGNICQIYWKMCRVYPHVVAVWPVQVASIGKNSVKKTIVAFVILPHSD